MSVQGLTSANMPVGELAVGLLGRCCILREIFVFTLKELSYDTLYFDESRYSPHVVRKQGWAKKGKRVASFTQDLR